MNIEAMVLDALAGWAGTLLYGACEADSDGLTLPLLLEYNDGLAAGGVIPFSAPTGNSAARPSPSSSSSSDESYDIDVASTCSTVEAPESEDVSDAVDGSYSCLRGEEDRLCLTWPW